MIRGFVEGQMLRLSQKRVVAGTLDHLVARFLFAGNEWRGLEVWMHLQQGEQHYAIKLTQGQSKKEDHLNLSKGRWRVWLHGNAVVDGEVVERITTNICNITVEETGGEGGAPMPPVAPTVAEQREARLTTLERRVESLPDAPTESAPSYDGVVEVV